MAPDEKELERKMDALARLAGGVAHDMNNMLGAIEGYATLSQRGLQPSSQLHSDMEEIRKAVARASSLTKRLTLFSSRQPAVKIKVELPPLLEGLSARLGAGLPQEIRIERSFEPGLPEVQGDPQRLERLFSNLLLNAADAMPAGGTIGLAAAEAGGFVKVSVSDHGQGMPPEVAEHLFEPFFTTKPKGKGAGLGLAEAYGIARQHGGRIEVSTAGGRGSEFSVFLPLPGKAVPS